MILDSSANAGLCHFRFVYLLLCVALSCTPRIFPQAADLGAITAGPTFAPAGTIPAVNVGGTYMESMFARLDFAQKLLDEQNREFEERKKQRAKLIESGTVSALDLDAPPKALGEFNKATELLRKGNSKEALEHLQKAVATYPKFVSAYNDLGLAFLDIDDKDHAKTEFEMAAKLDDRFAQSFLNLGQLELSQKDYASADSSLEKAASLRPADAKLLTVLAYAQNESHEYHHAIDTAVRVHSLEHTGLANVHYIAAASAIALKDFDIVQRELELFMKEDPTNPLAPSATYNLKILASAKTQPTPTSESMPLTGGVAKEVVRTFPNSDALKNALASLGSDDDICADCAKTSEASLSSPPLPNPVSASTAASNVTVVGRSASGVWKIRDVIDEVAVFFSVTSHGKLVNDLEEKDLAIRDDSKPPLKVLQFTPQSKLPLRLGLLVDVSGSLQQRFSFEKQAAIHFIQGMLVNPSDLAFIAGFSDGPKVSEDFSADVKQLSQGIESLHIGGGTAIWDAVSFSCWKLAAYPEKERVAKVLVVLTDGEDNLSHTTLKQAIQDAENTGVTVYAISTKDFSELGQYGNPISDSDKVLQELTERTGGEALFPGDLRTLNRSFDKLCDVIRSRYLVAYRPADFQSNGHFRKINIVATKKGRRLKVLARQGYYTSTEAKTGS
jgi:VWFA-related protein